MPCKQRVVWQGHLHKGDVMCMCDSVWLFEPCPHHLDTAELRCLTWLDGTGNTHRETLLTPSYFEPLQLSKKSWSVRRTVLVPFRRHHRVQVCMPGMLVCLPESNHCRLVPGTSRLSRQTRGNGGKVDRVANLLAPARKRLKKEEERKQQRQHTVFFFSVCKRDKKGSLSTNGPSISPLTSIDLWHLIYLPSIGSNEVRKRAIQRGRAPVLYRSFHHNSRKCQTGPMSGLDLNCMSEWLNEFQWFSHCTFHTVLFTLYFLRRLHSMVQCWTEGPLVLSNCDEDIP